MDAATLVMIVMLADGSRREVSQGFPNLARCEAFKDEAVRRLPRRLTLVHADCRSPLRISKPGHSG